MHELSETTHRTKTLLKTGLIATVATAAYFGLSSIVAEASALQELGIVKYLAVPAAHYTHYLKSFFKGEPYVNGKDILIFGVYTSLFVGPLTMLGKKAIGILKKNKQH